MRDILRSNIQASYQLGIAYVSSIEKREGYLTTSDLVIIKQLVDDYIVRFWGRIDILIQDLRTEKNTISNNFISTSLATDICVKTLNSATAKKARAIIQVQNDPFAHTPSGITKINQKRVAFEQRLERQRLRIMNPRTTPKEFRVKKIQKYINLGKRTGLKQGPAPLSPGDFLDTDFLEDDFLTGSFVEAGIKQIEERLFEEHPGIK